MQQQFLSQSAAAAVLNPTCPPSPDTMRVWHDRLAGPRDSAGRRLWPAEIVERIRKARAESRKSRAAA